MNISSFLLSGLMREKSDELLRFLIRISYCNVKNREHLKWKEKKKRNNTTHKSNFGYASTKKGKKRRKIWYEWSGEWVEMNVWNYAYEIPI